ncbi:hypothetical protein CA13_01250 [Planctomycetes bacterium CA13]|uniref:Uncharacterized protein n=1 Tax=Novipirellula herctigrandis TaxID=2527986 RepID=A0A5C5YUQ4_9BACT|nr:hypothetical protein CA13_01250 [Planctomycetes bacterium CA13]
MDDSTAASVLEQIDEAITSLQSESSSGATSREAFQSVVNDVLEANGIDSGEFEEAIQAGGVSGARAASGAGGPSGGRGPSGAGRPNGPPPRREAESETSEVESALLSAGVDEASIDELINQMIETIAELTSESGSNVSQDDLQSSMKSLFDENGVDFDAFEQSLSEQFGATGSFLDRLV